MADPHPVVSYSKRAKFDDVRDDLKAAIEGKGWSSVTSPSSAACSSAPARRRAGKRAELLARFG